MLCLDSKRIVNLKIDNANISIFDRNIDKDIIYSDKYTHLQKMDGIWYQIEPLTRLAGDYKHEFFNLSIEDSRYRIIFEESALKNQLICVLNKIRLVSPKRKIFLVVDLQGDSFKESYVHWKDFISLINDDELEFNTLYEIS